MRHFLLLFFFFPTLLLAQNNVGIGLTTPTGKLHLKANSNLAYSNLRITEEGLDYARIKLENDVMPASYWDIAGRTDTIADNAKLNFFYHTPGNWGDRMTITGAGNVGIRNTNPQAKLDILGGSWNLEGGSPGDLRIGNNTYNLRMSMSTGGGGAGTARIFAGGGISTIFFGTNNTRRMVINGNGDVGIGIDSPTERLHVEGGLRIGDLSGTGDRNVIVDAAGKFKIGTTGVGDSDWTETASHVYNNTHDIGIGTSSPGAKLHVVGPESNGSTGALKLTFPGTAPFYTDAHSMVLDGNEIDVLGTLSNNLVLQGNSNGGITLGQGGGNIGIGQAPSSARKVMITGDPIPASPGSLITAPGSFAIINTSTGFSEMVMDGNEIHSIDEDLLINTKSSRNIRMTDSNGKVGIGVAPTAKLTVEGADNNGTNAAVEIRSPGGSQRMLLDGNEIDVIEGNKALHLNANSAGPVTIGTLTVATGYDLSVDGKIMAEEVRVQLSEAWPDYVFKPDYELMALEDVKRAIAKDGHLPGVPAASVVESEGIALGDMQRMMMEKIEELTLHLIDVNERLKQVEQENVRLKTALISK